MVTDIGRNIKSLIENKGLRQNYVAKKIGISEKKFSDMLNGRATIKACYIPDISTVLGVTPDVLFGIETKKQ